MTRGGRFPEIIRSGAFVTATLALSTWLVLGPPVSTLFPVLCAACDGNSGHLGVLRTISLSFADAFEGALQPQQTCVAGTRPSAFSSSLK